jgi:hypothetical protein
MSPEQHNVSAAAHRLGELRAGRHSLAEVLAFYDSLPAVQVEDLMGVWHGHELSTGNPFDGLLYAFGWYGKEFRSADDVRPLVFTGHRGRFEMNPSLLPMPLALRYAAVLRRPGVARAARAVLPLLRTRRPQARLRMVEYRGVPTATMIYDAKPINDHFRAVDRDTLVGLMDLRGMAATPFAFVLERAG